MTDQFHKLLLSQLHMVVYRPGNPEDMTDNLLCEAVTVNENLQSLGYTLKPEELLKLSVSPSLYAFYEDVKKLVPDVLAEPMYPGFPQQVMEMSEAEFRMHQMMHYFSTYGLELLFGAEVKRGWLPDSRSRKRHKVDTRLIDASVVELVPEAEAPIAALKAILNRRERLTNPELELVAEAAPLCAPEQLQGLNVRFKENIELLFPLLMEMEDREIARCTLRCICAHTGDVFRCAAQWLGKRKYHLVTGEKKLLVKLLESYAVQDFRRNLMQSIQIRERNLNVLKHLDYNRFSRSPEHLEAVRALRNGELLSWHGISEQLLKDRTPEALTHLAERPGYMIRMLNRLLSLGYQPKAILNALEPRSGAVSAHLLIRVIRTLSARKDDLDEKYRRKEEEITVSFSRKMEAFSDFMLQNRYRNDLNGAEIAKKCAVDRLEEEYLRIPIRRAEEEARSRVRPLELDILRKTVELNRAKLRLKKLQEITGADGVITLTRNAVAGFDMDLLENGRELNAVRSEVERLEDQILQMQAEYQRREKIALAWLEREKRIIELKSVSFITDGIELAQETYEKRVGEIEREYRKNRKNAAGQIKQLQQEKRKALANLQKVRKQEEMSRNYDDRAVKLLYQLLDAHFRNVTTPLKGKKVFLQMDQFDLEHSMLETEDRSKDGGYIRSGICWKIPEDARFVRFFTYWNDEQRIDIDLHANGKTVDGRDLHVGWNSDFRDCGVLHSGDITHSDAAEYIDIDLSRPVAEIFAYVHLFNADSLRDVETCYVGMMAVDRIGADVKHYDPANCFFTHELTQSVRSLYYGYVDVRNRFVRFVGKKDHDMWYRRPSNETPVVDFSLQEYLDRVLEAQGVHMVKSIEKADVVLTMGKSAFDNGVSLVDNNFFLEC